MKRASGPAGFSGRWRIIEMELWDKDFLDMDVPAFIEIERRRGGRFQFGLVSGELDWRIEDHPGGKRLEFTWEGNDECDHACGSGWARLNVEGKLEGEIRFHQADRSGFLARRAGGRKPGRKTTRTWR